MSAPTSSVERFQFSVEKPYTVRYSDPHSGGDLHCLSHCDAAFLVCPMVRGRPFFWPTGHCRPESAPHVWGLPYSFVQCHNIGSPFYHLQCGGRRLSKISVNFVNKGAGVRLPPAFVNDRPP